MKMNYTNGKKLELSKWLIGIAIVFSSLTGLQAQTVISVGSNITANTSWNADTVKLTNNIDVSAKLTIAPGTHVVAQGFYTITVTGAIVAEGAPGDSIVFTVLPDSQSTGWGGIRFFLNVSADSSIFHYCVFKYAKAKEAYAPLNAGGALYISDFSMLRVSNSRFSYNTSASVGGAVYCESASPVIVNNTFTYNTAATSGGGLAIRATSKPFVFGNDISFNQAGANGNGGGLFLDSSPAKVFNNKICNNSSKQGAGIYIQSTAPFIKNNLIANNSALGVSKGGGVYILLSSPQFYNNTVVNNSAVDGGGFCLGSSSKPDIVNSIIWGNVATSGLGNQFRLIATTADPPITNSCVQGGTAAFSFSGGTDTYIGAYTNNIATDPLLVAATAGAGYTYNATLANFRLQATSPCANTGKADTTGMGLPATDLASVARIVNGTIDMGCYEFKIPDPLSVNISDSTNLTCYNNASGTATAQATGGTSPYTYVWSNSKTGAFNNGLSASVFYTVTVSDYEGNTATDKVSLSQPAQVTASAGVDKSICSGASVSMTATGGGTYSWSSGETTASITKSPTSTTTYTVTVTVGACSASDAMVVTVNAAPVANAGGNKTLCSGNSFTTTASGGTTFAWSSGETTASITKTPLVTTTYTVTVTQSGCSASSSLVATVTSAVVANAGLDQSICAGGTAAITASGGTTYAWSSGETTAIINKTPSVTTTYTVTASSGSCSATDAITITVTSSVVANAGTDKTICSGQSVSLTASGGTTYAWNTGQTTASITQTPLSKTTYTVTATTAGCSASDAVVVTVTISPVANAGLDKTVCAGKNVSFTATGGTSYAWSSGETTAALTKSPTSTTTYTVTVTSLGCTASDAMVVTATALPVVNAGVDQAVCFGASASFTATGGTTYQWNSGETSDIINKTPAITSTYTVTATANGCSASDAVVLTVKPYPTADAGIDKYTCIGSSVSMTATGGDTYLWNTGDVTAAIEKSPVINTTYTVTATLNGCTASDFVSVSVYAIPVADAGADQVICLNDTVEMLASGGDSYTWNTGHATAFASAIPHVTTTYVVTVFTNGCTDTDELVVTIKDIPSVNAGVDVTICKGESASLSAYGATSYAWSTMEMTQQISVSPTSNSSYTVAGLGVNGCSASDQVIVSVTPLPTADAGADQIIETGTSASLTAAGGTAFVWSNASTEAVIVVQPSSVSTYIVTVTKNNCTAVDSVIVTPKDRPVANAGEDVAICIGDSVALTAVGGDTYVWSTGATLSDITVKPLVTTTYIVTASNGLTDTDEIVVTVHVYPTANAGVDQFVCEGTTVSVSAQGGDVYAWSNGITKADFTDVPITTITYTVTISQNGCSASDDIQVSVKVNPIANAGVDHSICAGETVALTAEGGSSYAWSTGDIVASIDVSPKVNTTYIVTATTNGCTDVDSVVVKFKENIVVNAGSDMVMCDKDSVLIKATTADKYLWSDGNTVASFYAKPAYSSLYVVTATIQGCTTTDAVLVTVNPVPTVNAGLDQVVCRGKAVSMTATGGATYKWNYGQKTAIVNDVPQTTQAYIVTATNTFSCTASDALMVTVNLLPTVSAGKDATICVGKSTTLTGNSDNAIVWSSGAETPITSVSPGFTTSYKITATTTEGCTATDVAVVTVNPLPALKTSQDTSICLGGQIYISASGGESYRWNNGSLSSSVNVKPTVTSSYTVTATNIYGCTASDFIQVTVKSLPIADAGVNDTICMGGTAHLSASGGDSYVWNTGGVGASQNLTVTKNSIYTVTVSKNGCTGTDMVAVVINQPYATAGSDQSYCLGNAAQLTAGGGVSYSWSNGAISQIALVSPTNKTTYTVTATNKYGCSATDDVVVSVGTTPSVNAGPDRYLCNGTQVTLMGTSNGSYLWSNGATVAQPVVSPMVTTTYILTSTGVGGCTATDNAIVFVAGSKAQFTVDKDDVTRAVTLTNTSVGTYQTLLWDFGDGSVSSQSNPNHIYQKPGLYAIMLQLNDTVAGCVSNAQTAITIGTVTCISSFDTKINNSNYGISCTSQSAGAITSYFWEFGDGSVSYVKDPTHKYLQPGRYTIALTVSTAGGACMHKSYETIEFVDMPCRVAMSFITSPNSTDVSFQSTVTGASTSIYWDFGDGMSSNDKNPTHTYQAAGYYTVTLTSYDSISQCTDEISKEVMVSSVTSECLASFAYQQDVGLNQVSFFNTTDNAVAATSNWDFGDGLTATGTHPQHEYAQAGAYTVCLAITNGTCKSLQCEDVLVKGNEPVCYTVFSTMVDHTIRRVSFTDNSQGSPTTWTWKFGDGTMSNEKNPFHVYKQAGLYLVYLETSTTSGTCSDQATKLIYVGNPSAGLSCKFGYEFDSSFRYKGTYPVTFLGSVLGNADAVKWTFGDGATNSTSLEPVHDYAAVGTYQVCLKVWNYASNDSAEYCESINLSMTDIAKQTSNTTVELSCMPNPVSTFAKISYYIPENDEVTLKVIDIFGRDIKTIENKKRMSGNYTLDYNFTNWSSGIYFVKLTTSKHEIVKRLIKLD